MSGNISFYHFLSQRNTGKVNGTAIEAGIDAVKTISNNIVHKTA